jgi:hypothetical protein
LPLALLALLLSCVHFLLLRLQAGTHFRCVHSTLLPVHSETAGAHARTRLLALLAAVLLKLLLLLLQLPPAACGAVQTAEFCHQGRAGLQGMPHAAAAAAAAAAFP